MIIFRLIRFSFRFIRLVYTVTIGTLESQEAKSLRIRMQAPMTQTESFKAPWRVSGMSTCWKMEEAAIWCPQVTAAAIDTPAREELSMHMLAGFLLYPLLFPLVSNLLGGAAHIQNRHPPTHTHPFILLSYMLIISGSTLSDSPRSVLY